MANINRVILTGNLTREPELRSLPSGSSVCELGLAVNERTKVNGEWVEKANFFNVVVFGAQGENCNTYLEKGRPVAIDGRLRYSSWEDKNGGGKRSKVEVVADAVQFLGSGPNGGNVNGNGNQAASPPAARPAAAAQPAAGAQPAAASHPANGAHAPISQPAQEPVPVGVGADDQGTQGGDDDLPF